MFTAPKHLNCAEWERDVTGGGWTPDYWIDEARKLGASYVVLATFHSRLGYARPWPSKIPGSCATERDLLGELAKAGKAKGVKVILYMTDDPQWHSEQGVQMLDSKAYSDYKGEQVDLTTREGFGKYSYDLFFEVMRNYNDLAGFWIDNDNDYWERNKLYEQIRQLQPTWLLSNNNEDTPIMDTVSNEQKTGMFPSYDYPAATFTPMPRLSEACYKLPNTGDWWYDGGNHAVDTRLNTGRYITNAGSSIKSLMAETPMVNGKMPAQQEAYNNFMAGWVPPIRESIQGVEGAGYAYGGMQPGFWNDGAHGVITINPKYRQAVRARRHEAARRLRSVAGQRLPGHSRDRSTYRRTDAVLAVRRAPVDRGHHELGPVRHRVRGGNRWAARLPQRCQGVRHLLEGRFPGGEPDRRQLREVLGRERRTARVDLAGPGAAHGSRVRGDQPARVVADARTGVVRPAGGLLAHQGLPADR